MNRILSTIIIALAFFGMDVGALAQTLSVDATSVRADGNAVLVVKAESLSDDVSALQFNLALPQGATLDETGITKGEAASSHTLEIRPLTNNSSLFVLYNLDMASIGNGELLRLPITLFSATGNYEGSLNTVRAATSKSVSQTLTDTQFVIESVVRGDVNHDGEVNVGDLVSVSNYMAGDENVSLSDADVNEDGEVNVGDLVTISNIMAGN